MKRVAVVAAFLILVSCTVTSTPPQNTPTTPTGGPSQTGPAATRAPGRTSTSAPSPGDTVTGSAPPATGAYLDSGAVGAMARTYLRSSPARSLVVEVDWMAGRKPTSTALDHLESILRRELSKPAGVDVRLGAQMATTRTSWTVDDLVAADRMFRAERSGGSRATMWVAFVGGSFSPAESALGTAFTASAAAVFRDRIDDATSALILASEIERSVLVHEAGHLLGLVNIGYTSRFDHEDPAHPKHSNNADSVMFWAVEDISLRNILAGGPPSDFDEADRADLVMLRAS